MFCDLHLHSTASDGTLYPETLAEEAAEAGLTAAALTDHNTIDGVRAFAEACRRVGVEPVSGIELTTRTAAPVHELHIVGLFLPEARFDAIRDFCSYWNRFKRQADRDCVARLRAAGYAVTDEAVFGDGSGSTNRVHIARALVAIGAADSVGDAIDRLLRPNRGFYIPAARPTPDRAVRVLHENGALAVWAHPLLSASREEIDRLVISVRPDAVETRYSAYTEDDSRFMREVAARHGLLESGGSDFHGASKPNVPIGGANVPAACYEALKKAHGERFGSV